MAAAVVVAVDDDPVVVVSAATGTHRDVAITNAGSATVYLGGSGVTSATGFPLGAGDDITVQLGEAEGLFGVCAAAASTSLRVLTVGV